MKVRLGWSADRMRCRFGASIWVEVSSTETIFNIEGGNPLNMTTLVLPPLPPNEVEDLALNLRHVFDLFDAALLKHGGEKK